MALRFPCIATARRRRAIAASMNSPSARVRRGSAALRRASGLWQLSAAERDASVLVTAFGNSAHTAATSFPSGVSRR
jgi:hypothetical protein